MSGYCWAGGNVAVISVVCCAAQPDPVVVWVQGPDIDRLRLGNYIAAEQRAGMRQLYAPRGGVANASVEPATQKIYGATVLVSSTCPTNVGS